MGKLQNLPFPILQSLDMNVKILPIILFIFWSSKVSAQSFETMLGTERIFIDAQYLKFFDEDRKISLFSRARATAEYDHQNTNLFTGAYLNYTTKKGVGGTVLGRISTIGSGVDVGIHYFKATKTVMIYALPSININDELLYSWFSIIRYTPTIKNDWKMYTSLELFSAFSEIGHLSSVQRIRLGIDKKGYQFGLAVNLNESRFSDTDINPGVFLRKQF
ncbi:hypothetical protein [Lacihabitans lacunae]|uniref:DUF481 domain-containing protein n=1 Tax=Lacihabitans lacunae TaxID=1028214 RepID=A0ABV7YXS4_9BACT